QPGIPVEDSDTANIECQTPDLRVAKECTNGEFADNGDFIYAVTVTNAGSAPLASCVVTDPTATCAVTSIASLPVGGAPVMFDCTSPNPTNTVTVECEIVGSFDPATQSPKKISADASAECEEECPPERKLAFEQFQAGDIVSNINTIGLGIGVTTNDPVNHPAMIFDTFNPTGGDLDLGTPNSDFGGPGIGNGGKFGEPGQNSLPLGKVLIISEDNDPSDPDDNAGGGTIIFTFDRPVPLEMVGILDIDVGEGGTVTAFDAEVGGAMIGAIASMQPLGNNSYQDVPFVRSGVRRLEVEFQSSGAVSSIVFCPEFCVEEAINDERVRVQAAGHAFWLPGIALPGPQDGFIFEPAGDFVPFDDGTALLTGRIEDVNDSSRAFQVVVQLFGRTDIAPPGSPKRELIPEAYADFNFPTGPAGPVDTSTFFYYTGFTGTLTGTEAFQGAVIEITPTGPAFQVGKGANNKNTNFGASAWFTWIVSIQPDDQSIVLPEGQGDINVDIPCECFDIECVPMEYVDDFESGTYTGGTGMWVGPWIENDPTGGDQSATQGNVQVAGGDLRLDNKDYPNPDPAWYPSAWRTADLTGKLSAWLKFDWHLGWEVDPSDSVVVEISTDGVNFTVLDTITGYTGMASGWETIDISAYISPHTTVRFRIEAYYGGWEEFFFVDFIRIEGLCEPRGGEDGCTPGYWKQPHHFDSWTTYSPTDDYPTTFGVNATCAGSLLDALEIGGGGEAALCRHATAALLNTANPSVNYFTDANGVIQAVQDAYATGDFETAKNLLDFENNRGCPLN
ncbi:MAG: hypothetical protein ACE5F5_13220, partial [Acidimicrobiia bacterium]